jgi:hypothetical protein
VYDRARERHGVVTSRSLGAKRLASARSRGEVVLVHRGVHRFRVARDTFDTRARAALLAASHRAACGFGRKRRVRSALAVLSHRSGAHVYRLRGGSADKIEIVCGRWDRSRHQGVTVHEMKQLGPNDVREVDGLLVVTPELVLLQFAAMPWTSIDFVERMFYEARRKHLVSVESVDQMLAVKARRGRPGVRKLRAALQKARRHELPPESDPEALLLQCCRAQGLGEPVLQYVLIHDGRFVGRFDGAFPQIRVLFEYQSMEHHQNEDEIARANDRRLAAFAAGWFVLEARWWDLASGGHKFASAVRSRRT